MPTFPSSDPSIISAINQETENLFPSQAPQVTEEVQTVGPEITPDQLQQEKQRYNELSGLPGEVAAAATGAARGISFGLSDLALTKTGLVSRETLSDLKKINPQISTVADLGSILATTLFSGGTSLLGQSARAAGVGVEALSAAARAAEGLVASGLEKGAAKTVAENIIKTAVAKAAGGAVEGVGFGAGGLVSDYALGDPDLNAEKIIGTLGLSAVLGGATGAGLSVASKVGPSFVEKAENATKSVSDMLSKASSEAANIVSKVSAKLSNQPEDVIQKFLAPGEEGKLIRQAAIRPNLSINEQKKQASELLQKMYDQNQAVSKEYFSHVRPQEIDEALLNNPVDNAASIGKAKEMLNQTMADFDSLDPEIFTDRPRIKRFQNAVKSALDDFETHPLKSENQIQTAGQAFKRINELKQEVDPIIRWDQLAEPASEASVNTLKSFRGQFKNYLTNPEIFEKAASVQQNINETFNKFFNASEDFENRFMRETIVNGKRVMQIEPQKLNRYFNDVEDFKNFGRDSTAHNFIDASKDLTQHIYDISGGPYNVAELIDNSPILGSSFAKAKEISEPLSKNLKEFEAQSVFKHLKHGEILTTSDAVKGLLAFKFLGPLGVAAMGAIKQLTHPENLIKGLASLERMKNGFSKGAEESIASFLAKGSLSASKAIRPASIKALQLSGLMTHEPSRKADKSDHYAEIFNQLNDFKSNPQKLINKVDTNLKDMNRIAPNISKGMTKVALTAVDFLHSKAPKNTNFSILGNKKWKPSDQELAQFERYYKAIEDPKSVLHDLRDGVISREGVETLKTIYPNFYQEIQRHILGKATELKEELPYRDRLQLSIFFGVPIERAMQPDFIRTLQGSFSQPQAAQSSDTLRPQGLQKLHFSENRQSNLDRALNR